MKSLALTALVLTLPGCFGKQAPNDFVEDDLFGKINGKEWAYKHAYVDPTIETPEEEDLVFVFLPYVPKKPCAKENQSGGPDSRAVMVSAPANTKLTKLKRGSPRTLVFQFDKKGEQWASAAKAGKVKLTAISGTEVKGKIFGSLNNGNWVSGTFSAVVCDYRDMQ